MSHTLAGFVDDVLLPQLRAMVQHGENIAKQTELFLFMAARAQLTHDWPSLHDSIISSLSGNDSARNAAIPGGVSGGESLCLHHYARSKIHPQIEIHPVHDGVNRPMVVQ